MRWALSILILWLWSTPLFAGDAPLPKETDVKITAEDMKVIEMMETLEMMDLMESLEIVEDMDILLEEKNNESQD
jgi:hypothetical protein